MIAVYGPGCERLGYANGTDQWRECILKMDTKDAITRYQTTPTTTSCFGHRGFFNCTTF